MPIRILMPALSPTMEEGRLVKWLVKEGDAVSSGDPIAEIETDKATMEMEAADDGIIGKILIAEGTGAVKVNAPIAVLLERGEDSSAVDMDADIGAVAPSPPQTTEAPTKATVSTQSSPAMPMSSATDGTRVFASPLARRIAAQKGLNLSSVKGSGPSGRIIKADVEGVARTASPLSPGALPSGGADAVKAIYRDREFDEMPLDGMRRTVAARLTSAKQTIPHFYLRRGIELDALLALRERMNAHGKARSVKLSINDYIIKACAIALQDVPDCNAVWAEDRILKFKASDVAVAVAIEGGLFTPVIRDAQAASLAEISTTMKDLANRARDRKLAPHEYQGASFSISNLGMYGVENFDAVINPPHGSILAVGAGVQKPVVRDGKTAIATVMSVTLSCDHRVIEGATGAQFLDAIKRNLEDPIGMLI